MFRKNNDSGSKSDRRIVFNASNNKSRPTKLNDRFKEIEETRKARQSSDRFSVVMKRRTGQRPKVSLMQEFNSKNKGLRRKRSGASIRDSISKRLGGGKSVPISSRLGNIDIKKRLNMKTASNRNNRTQRNSRRGGSSSRGRGRGRGGRNGGSKRPLNKEALDKDLDNYMFENKEVAQSTLDNELDVYMKERNDGKNSPSAEKKEDVQMQE